MREQWRIDLTADGLSPERVERRIARGSILFDAPEVIVVLCTGRCPRLPGRPPPVR